MTSYYTPVASLPPLPRQFDAGPIPVTAASLRRRVTMLDIEHQQVVRQLGDFFRWDRQPQERSDAEVRVTYRRLTAAIRNPLVTHIVHHRFEMRTLVAAIRHQRGGLPPPDLPELPLSIDIRRNWDQPRFRLDARFSWLPPFCQALDENRPKRAKWHLFSELWNHWSRLDEAYYFTFESFVLYLARWEILRRWVSQDATRGQQRFGDLVDNILQSGGAHI